MAIDYSVYQKQYEDFNRILSQMQALSTYSSGLFSGGQVSATQNFASIFENTAGKTGVSESMDAIFEEAAGIYQVPVALLKAVGKVESNFNASAVSSAGAQGVMQLMPGTAKELGVEDSFDARSNIMGGAKYLAQMLKKYKGDIDLTLAAYNAGCGTVAKYGGVPSFTRKYIAKVKRYMGQDLTTGRTVSTRTYGTKAQTARNYTSSALAAQAYGRGLLSSGIQGTSGTDTSQLEMVTDILERVKSGYTDHDQEDVQYYTQLMKMQMQNQAIGVLGQLLSDDEEEQTSLFDL